MAFAKDRLAFFAADSLWLEMHLQQGALGSFETKLLIGNWDLCLCLQQPTELFTGILVRPREVAPDIGKALDRSCNYRCTDQYQESYKPVRVKYICETRTIQDPQHLWGVCPFHFFCIGRGPLQDYSAGRRKDHNQNDQDYSRLDGPQGPPDLATHQPK